MKSKTNYKPTAKPGQRLSASTSTPSKDKPVLKEVKSGVTAVKKVPKKIAASPKSIWETTSKAVDEKSLAPQAMIIYNTLKSVGPCSMEKLVSSVSSKLKTKQEPIKVVAFYRSILVSKGFVAITKSSSEE